MQSRRRLHFLCRVRPIEHRTALTLGCKLPGAWRTYNPSPASHSWPWDFVEPARLGSFQVPLLLAILMWQCGVEDSTHSPRFDKYRTDRILSDCVLTQVSPTFLIIGIRLWSKQIQVCMERLRNSACDPRKAVWCAHTGTNYVPVPLM